MNNCINKITIIVSFIVILAGVFVCSSLLSKTDVTSFSNNIVSESFSHTNSSSFITNPHATYLVDDYSLGGGNESIGDISTVSIISAMPLGINNTSFSCSRSSQSKQPTPRIPETPTTGNIPSTASSLSFYSSNCDVSISSGLLLIGSSLVRISAHNLLHMGSFWFFIAFIGNILLMLLGRGLRLHSGRSPGYAYAF